MVQQWSGTYIPNTYWTPANFSEYQEIIRLLTELDRKLGLANCEDPAKAAWMENIEKRMKKLEKQKTAKIL